MSSTVLTFIICHFSLKRCQLVGDTIKGVVKTPPRFLSLYIFMALWIPTYAIKSEILCLRTDTFSLYEIELKSDKNVTRYLDTLPTYHLRIIEYYFLITKLKPENSSLYLVLLKSIMVREYSSNWPFS